MVVKDKLTALTRSARFDVCGYEGTPDADRSPLRFLYNAALPNGGTVCLFKVLQTNVCVNDCAYCVSQVGRDCPRFVFQPDELAKTFMELNRKRIAKGLFLSSAVSGNAAGTMDRMLRTVEILRRRYAYRGYIHLKIMPGAPFDCVEAACRLADRVSLNMEAPTPQHLARLSTRKDLLPDIVERMRWVKRISEQNETWAPSGQTTQFVVGAAGESDRELLNSTSRLYNDIGLRRVYFSAFNPVTDSRLENTRPTPPIREHRLYQTDWLLRVYGFPPEEVALALKPNGYLPLLRDPKLTIARKEPWRWPLDVNRAAYEELLRVPGIGPTSAQRIVEARREHSIDSMAQLKKMKVVTKRAAHYIWYAGMLEAEKQLPLPEPHDEDEEAELEEAALKYQESVSPANSPE